MSNVVSLPIPKEDVVAEIQQIAVDDDGRIALTNHLRQRMEERGVLERQVLQCIRHGLPVAEPVWDTDIDPGWKVAFDRFCAGDRLRVAVKLVDKDGYLVLVLTAYVKGNEDV